MAKIKLPIVPLSAEDRHEFVRLLQRAEEPMDAAKVAKLAMTSRRPTRNETAAILEQFVADGVLVAWPAKTAKGKPRFWDRDLKSFGQTALTQLVRECPEPVTAKEVKSISNLPFQLSISETANLLIEIVKSGAIFEIPSKTAKSGVRYWRKDAREFGRHCLLMHVRDQPPQTISKLNGYVKWLNPSQLKTLVEQLTAEGELYCHPPLRKSGSSMWGHTAPAPEPYLKEVRDQLATVVTKLKSASVSQADLRRAVVQMLDSVGIVFGDVQAGTTTDAPSRCNDAVDLVRLMRNVEPRADRGALVSARLLRNAAAMSKTDFDSLVLQLARQGKIVLHEHDFSASLSSEDRDDLIADGQGSFYVGIAIRPNKGDS